MKRKRCIILKMMDKVYKNAEIYNEYTVKIQDKCQIF